MTGFDLETALAGLDDIGTRDCKDWRDRIFRKSPVVACLLIPAYCQLAIQSGHKTANAWLRELSQRLQIGQLPLTIGSEDDAIKDYSKTLARSMRKGILPRIDNLGAASTLEVMHPIIASTGLDLNKHTHSGEKKTRGFLLRCCDDKWWFRKLKRIQRRGYESIARELGHVQKSAGIYVSNLNYERRIAQKKGNRQLMEMLVAENEVGQSYTLAELQDLSPSNPLVKLAELMVRMRGFEDIALNSPEEYVGLFFTVTCPSKYHAFSANGYPNKNFNGATPLEAQAYLNDVWARVRAALQRAGIQPFGMRVVEPHHDATPHWHLLLFVPRHQQAEMIAIFRSYAMLEDGDEPGAEKHRFKVEEIDPNKGSATGYIAKYIAKNINGQGLETDLYGRDATLSAYRIEAWASVWGIRQFQQIGGPSVTVYRELRRLKPQEDQDDEFENIRKPADASDWAEFTQQMGGAICRRKDRPIMPLMAERKSLNLYGEIVLAVKGLKYGATEIITRIHTWVVSIVPETLIRGLPGETREYSPDAPEQNPDSTRETSPDGMQVIPEGAQGLPGDTPGSNPVRHPHMGTEPHIRDETQGNAGFGLNGLFFDSVPTGTGNLEYCQ